MHDSDGPTLARAVYHAIFEGVSQPVFSNPPISAELIVEPDSAATDASLVKHSIPCIPSFPSSYSSAGIIDAVARHLRVDKQLSAVRWATFVHVGV